MFNGEHFVLMEGKKKADKVHSLCNISAKYAQPNTDDENNGEQLQQCKQ